MEINFQKLICRLILLKKSTCIFFVFFFANAFCGANEKPFVIPINARENEIDDYVEKHENISGDNVLLSNSSLLQKLLKTKKNLFLNEIKSISINDAKLLSTCLCFVHLDGLEKIPNQTLDELTRYGGNFSLGGLKEIGPIEAGYLSRCYIVSLNGLKKINSNTVKLICQNDKPGRSIHLNGLNSIDVQSLNFLGESNSNVYLNGVTSLPKECCETFSYLSGSFWLNGLNYLDNHFDILVKSNAEITFAGIKTLSEKQAFSYRFGTGKVHFPGLIEIPLALIESMKIANNLRFEFINVRKINTNIAMNLAACSPCQIILPGITKLTSEESYWLGLGSGLLYLSGIKNLDSSSAQNLSRYFGYLSLDGIKELPNDVAERLSKHLGSLSLNGVRELSETGARFLGQHNGQLNLNGIRTISYSSYYNIIRQQSNSLYWTFLNKVFLPTIYTPFFFNHLYKAVFKTNSYNGILKMPIFFNNTISMKSLFSDSVFYYIPLIYAKKQIYINAIPSSHIQLWILSFTKQDVYLSRMEKLSLLSLIFIRNFKGTLNLRDYQEMDNPSWYFLGLSNCDIVFGEINFLTDFSAMQLSNSSGYIYLGKLKTISKNSALYLSQKLETIALSNDLLTSINDSEIINILKKPPFQIR